MTHPLVFAQADLQQAVASGKSAEHMLAAAKYLPPGVLEAPGKVRKTQMFQKLTYKATNQLIHWHLQKNVQSLEI